MTTIELLKCDILFRDGFNCIVYNYINYEFNFYQNLSDFHIVNDGKYSFDTGIADNRTKLSEKCFLEKL